MAYYFEDHNSMFEHAGTDIKTVLRGVAGRYMAENPPFPLTYRAYSRKGIVRGKDYRYHADFNEIFPDAANEQYVYAWAKYWSDSEGEMRMAVTCFGPVTIYCNDSVAFQSSYIEERYADNRHIVDIHLREGWNNFVIRFKKTPAGFGGIFGTWLGKFNLYFLMPSKERDGQEGWIHTQPMSEELELLPAEGMSEKDTGVKWYPQLEWDQARQAMGQLKRIFGLKQNTYAVGWTRLVTEHMGLAQYRLEGHSTGPVTVYIDEKEVCRTHNAGEFSESIALSSGRHDIMLKCLCTGDDWGFDLSIKCGHKILPFESPCRIRGTEQKWIYAGPFGEDQPLDFKLLKDMNTTIPSLEGDTYWRVDLPDTWVRPYNENPLYGKWNYPLGVTLYGLLHSSMLLENREALEYVRQHVQLCCDTFHYAMWDKEQYGGATTIHNLLTSIDSLDDCGSFGSLVLEAARHLNIKGYRDIADYIADYISNKQVRLEDGTLFRKNMMHSFHEDTMWADDLYMSVPFLCRYYRLTGDPKYIDDAAHQFLSFKKHLYIPELKVMSHVYDFKRDMATGVPWGRGNGWVAFSLSELLEVLPQNHEKRSALIEMFRDLCGGYLALQDSQGMWHQVLNDHESYPESSCTSMFIYAFSRGVRYGWLDNADEYVKSAFKAWEALTRTSIDRKGNIYGVCRGSEFSFTPSYYKYELFWTLNDTHGIGIVMLAGVELTRLEEYISKA